MSGLERKDPSISERLVSREIQACQSFNKILFKGNGQGRMNLMSIVFECI